MRRFSINRLIHQVMLPVTLVSFMSACHKWSELDQDPREFVSAEHPDEIRVHLSDGTKADLDLPVVRGDTLIGVDGDYSLLVALSEVDKIEVRKGDWVGTTLFVLGAVVGASLVFVAVALSVCSGSFACPR